MAEFTDKLPLFKWLNKRKALAGNDSVNEVTLYGHFVHTYRPAQYLAGGKK